MAAIVHGCGSPRQHHGGGNMSTSGSCMPSSHHPHQLQHQTSAPMYSSMPKYTRSSSQPTATPNHHHIYGSNGGSSSQQFKKSVGLPSSASYIPMNAASQTQQFASGQRPSSASATVGDTRSYLAHPGGATMLYRGGRLSSRKSAVELLAESKPYYVKSETVMERLQQSNYRTMASLGCGNKRGRHSLDSVTSERFNMSYASASAQQEMDRCFGTSMHHSDNGGRVQHLHHHHHHGHSGRRSTVSANNLLQSKLRKLLSTDTKDMCSQRQKDHYRDELPSQFDFSNKTPSGNCIQEHSLLGNSADSTLMIPPSYLSPQSLPLQLDSFDDIYNFTGDNNSTEGPLVLTDDYRPISPPAEYAADTCPSNNDQRSRYNYQRSYSHSQEMSAEDRKYATTAAYNINSHKSLPDLHSQISRHSPHSEILSCCSRGNRSMKSTGESSLNRDSGGSSGHYTHRSEPCYKQRENEREAYENKVMCTSTCCEYRRDSGSSTQHSANSYCGYASPSYRNIDCAECLCKTNVSQMDSSDYLFNFTTPEVPEAFQDDYSPPSPSVAKYAHLEEKRFSNASSHQQQLHSVQEYQQQRAAKQTQNAMLHSPGSAPSVDDLSPPPIQFKRQKCIRFKNRNRVSISNTPATNEPDRGEETTYHRSMDQRPTFFFPKTVTPETHYKRECGSRRNSHQSIDLDMSRGGESVSDLEKFFDRLGLNDDKFHEIYSPPKRRRSAETDSDESSTVFFSDVSTVDSMRLPDSTETQPQTTQTYRPSEPPSIVERNARIIKWLCNCRKLQYT